MIRREVGIAIGHLLSPRLHHRHRHGLLLLLKRRLLLLALLLEDWVWFYVDCLRATKPVAVTARSKDRGHLKGVLRRCRRIHLRNRCIRHGGFFGVRKECSRGRVRWELHRECSGIGGGAREDALGRRLTMLQLQMPFQVPLATITAFASSDIAAEGFIFDLRAGFRDLRREIRTLRVFLLDVVFEVALMTMKHKTL